MSAFGGGLIGASAVLLMGALGRIAGISGIAAGLLVDRPTDYGWRLSFLIGMAAGPFILRALTGESGIGEAPLSWPWMLLSGLLVGVGTRLGTGCTSGHGVCGTARLSRRSIAATGVFIVFGMGAVFLVRHVMENHP